MESKQYYITQIHGAIAAGQLAFIVGSQNALPSSLIPQLMEETGPLQVNFQQGSWTASLYQYSCIVASLLGGYICEYFGRRKTSLIVGLPIFLSSILLATAPSFPVLLLARVLSSLATWVIYPSASVFVAEISHPDLRGTLATIPPLFLSIGMLLSYLLGYLVHWRIMCWILCSQSILMMVAMYFVKESPYWLVNNDMQAEAQASLQWYRGPTYDISKEYNELIEKKKTDKQSDGGIRNLIKTVKSPTFLKAMMSGSVLMFCNQFTGIPSLIVFMTNVFKDSGSTVDPKLAPVIVTSVRVLFTFISSMTQRKANRKVVFCCCMVVLAACTGIMGTYTYLTQVMKVGYLDNLYLGFLPLILTIIMFMAYGFGIIPTLHLINSEVFPGRTRSLGCGISLSLGMGGGGINSNLYPALLNLVGFHGVFWFYSCFTLLVTIYASQVIPDNRGKSLVKIQANMEGDKCVESTQIDVDAKVGIESPNYVESSQKC